MHASLKATTAILASLTLISPTTLPAQGIGTLPIACADGSAPPCGDEKIGEAPEAAEPEAVESEEAEPEEEAEAEETEPEAVAPETSIQPEPSPVDEGAADTGTDSAEEGAAAQQDAPEQPAAHEPAEAAPEEPAAEAPGEVVPPEGSLFPVETLAPEAVTPAPAPEPETAPETVDAPVDNTPPPEAAAAQADADDPEAGELETETVTEETARSSDEDFTGAITAETGAVTEDSGGGMSKLEKALLLGAGALAVGALVRGNREVVGTSQDRLVVSGRDGNLEVLKDDNALLRQPGSEIQTRTFDDGSTRTITTRTDGSQVITVRDADLRVIRRVLVRTDGTEVTLIDDTTRFEPVDVTRLPAAAPDVRIDGSQDALRAALERQGAFDRTFSLAQIRQISEVRKLAPAIEVDTITFETGSAAIRPEQAESLAELGNALARLIAQNPNEVFLVEGHTDAVGSASTNLILSDRRAESLALALTEYFDVPPENLVVQGYGESDLKVATETAERANRRAGVRRITQLMQVASR